MQAFIVVLCQPCAALSAATRLGAPLTASLALAVEQIPNHYHAVAGITFAASIPAGVDLLRRSNARRTCPARVPAAPQPHRVGDDRHP